MCLYAGKTVKLSQHVGNISVDGNKRYLVLIVSLWDSGSTLVVFRFEVVSLTCIGFAIPHPFLC